MPSSGSKGYMWAARKLVTTLRMNMSFEVDEDGDLLFTSKVPGRRPRSNASMVRAWRSRCSGRT